MKFIIKTSGYIKKILFNIRYFFFWLSLKNETFLIDIFQDQNRNYTHRFFTFYYHFKLPKLFKLHRKYFKKRGRGFGEDAFHSMWFYLFKEFKPKNILEIGVYRGQTVSLFSMLSDYFNLDSKIFGITPMNNSGDGVSNYISIDYKRDIAENCISFSPLLPKILKAYSTESKAIDFINSKKWDLIYIDGNHDYEVVKSDFEVCSKNLNHGGLIILDDSSLYTDYIPPFYSNAGHPGPSKFANEIKPENFKEVLSCGHNRVFQKLS